MFCIFKAKSFSMKFITSALILFFPFFIFSQNITGSQLLEKAIQYHDPNDNWSSFNAQFFVTMETPKSPNRLSNIKINLPSEYFYLESKRDTTTTSYTLNKAQCTISVNGNENPSEAELKAHNLSCDRAKLFKNYYTYLYGLPMKLKDNGTNIDEKVELKTFKGKQYLVLKATYDKSVGSDIWYFYFDPKTYAMEVYQFFKTDESGKLKPQSGEYILLTGSESINDIKIPKTRAWYYNKEDKYLGTDILTIQ